MKATDKHNIRNATLMLSVLVTVALTTTCLGSLSTQDKILKHYAVDIHLFSVDLTQPMDRYRSHGGGTAGVNSTVSFGCSDDVRNFRIDVSGKNAPRCAIPSSESKYSPISC